MRHPPNSAKLPQGSNDFVSVSKHVQASPGSVGGALPPTRTINFVKKTYKFIGFGDVHGPKPLGLMASM